MHLESEFGGFSTKYRNETLNITHLDAASSVTATKTAPMFA